MQFMTDLPVTKILLPTRSETIRALVVEENVLWAHAHATILEENGCAVIKTSSVDEALDLLQACYFHIVIMDAGYDRLHRTIYQNKWFGYTVVCVCSEKLNDYDDPIFFISGEQETGIILNDVLYISKSDYFPGKFWGRIHSELIKKGLLGLLEIEQEEHIGTLSYLMTNNMIEHIESESVRTRLHGHHSWVAGFYKRRGYEALRKRVEYEIYDLLRRCINVAKIKTIRLMSINGGLSKAAVIGITPKIEGKWSKTYILKLGYHKEIINERDAYDNHVKFILERGPKADTGPETPLLSSIMYDFVENGRSFGEVYKDMTYVKTEEIEGLLDDLFLNVYREWFRNPVDGRVEADDYIGYLNCRINRLIEPIKYIESQPELRGYSLWGVDRIRLPGIPRLLANPIHYVDDDDFLKKLNYAAPTAITHGDLNANNILIRNDSEAWLIDFSRTDHSHALRDFIQLETVVRFALMDGPTLAERYEMENYLAEQRTFGQVARLRKAYTPTGPNAKILERAFRISCKIRELAWETALSKHDDTRQVARFDQYKMGLFFMSLTTVRFVKQARNPNGLNTTQALHALMAAALLVERLK